MRKRAGSAMLIGMFFISLFLTVGLTYSVVTNQVYYEHQVIQRALDAAAVAGATQKLDSSLFQNILALDKTAAAAKTRSIAAFDLAQAAPLMSSTPSALAAAMTVTVCNIGDLDPWTGIAVTAPTVFIDAITQEKGLITYLLPGASVGSFDQNPLKGSSYHIRSKATLRTHS